MSIDIWGIENEGNRRNMSNANIQELFSMLEIEFDDGGGEFEGIKLVSFIEKLNTLKGIINRTPNEFSTPELRIKGERGCINIYPSKTAEYWIRIIDKLLEISQNTTKVCWG